jgi:hypothetical protein
MNRLSVRIPAPEGTRFAPDAFTAQVGSRAQLAVDTFGVKLDGVLVVAAVADDGSSVFITVETEDDEGLELLP